ncbi:MAG: HNH endonuclease [Anaerolineae bacterium]|nr:HNH endonuclease [Anaerolineae bacterium]MDW8098900.1 HNH endonuclease [Anaerolineae bacterium]
MQSVLVLNASYEPLSIISLKRAVILLLKEKAEIIEAAEAVLRSEHIELPVPLVIRLVYYVRIPRRLGLPLSRRTVMARDQYTCQYCGAQPGRAELTLDHVVPRSLGGETIWENVVTACRPCNQRKGNRLPAQAGLRLRSEPRRPQYVALAFMGESTQHHVWRKYLG